jgi:ACS family hexuronate transporter-like MFS transporter
VPYFFTFWLPQYLLETRGFSVALIGLIAWIPFLAADVGGLSGGALSDWLVRHGLTPAQARRRMMGAAACLTPAAFVAVRAESNVLALASVAAVLAAHSCWTVNLQTSITETFPAHQTGAAIGMSGVGSSLGGIIATLLTGQVVGLYGYVPVFSVLAFVHAVAFVVLTRARRGEAGAVPDMSLAR